MSRELTRTVEATADIPMALQWVRVMVEKGLQAGSVVIVLRRPKRTLDQNSKLHAMLGDIARQVTWHGRKLDVTSWKTMASAALKRQEVVPGLDGQSFVVLGAHTSQMNVKEVSDLIELLYAFGAEHSVEWSEPAK